MTPFSFRSEYSTPSRDPEQTEVVSYGTNGDFFFKCKQLFWIRKEEKQQNPKRYFKYLKITDRIFTQSNLAIKGWFSVGVGCVESLRSYLSFLDFFCSEQEQVFK